MNNKITTIVFDYGGVISLLQNSNHIDAICEILNIDVSEYRSVYQKDRNDYDSGIISAEDYWHTVISNIDINKSISDNVQKPGNLTTFGRTKLTTSKLLFF